MNKPCHAIITSAANDTDLGAILVSLELSRSRWAVTSLSPCGGEKMSKHCCRAAILRGSWSVSSFLLRK